MNPVRLTPSMVRSWLPKRSRDAHKGTVGRVLVVAGSRGMTGAAALSTLGAVRSGAGLVRLIVPRSEQPVAAKISPLEITTQGVSCTRDGQLDAGALREILKTMTIFDPRVVAVGPGLGRGAGVRSAVRGMLDRVARPMVVDADALRALISDRKRTKGASRVITPHEGELARCLGWSVHRVRTNRTEAVAAGAKSFRCVCVLKGRGTLISDGNRIYKNPTGNAKMAAGGMGDVLTGMIASVWAQKNDPSMEAGLRAAAVAVYWHGLAGDLLARARPGLSVAASDVAEYLSKSFTRIHREAS